MELARLRSALPTVPLAVACAALVAAALPLGEQVPGSALVVFLGCVAARLYLNVRRALLPALPVRLLLLASGVAVVSLHHGTIFGLEPGLGVLLILISLKLLEANSARDLQVLALLGIFLGLCNLFFAQDLSRWLFIAAVCGGLMLALILFYGTPEMRTWPALRLVFSMLLQAAPIAAVLFLCFPQTQLGFRVLIGRPASGMASVSEEMSPGSMASLAQKDEPAFRARFEKGEVPLPSAMYWRGVVLWRCEGLTWLRGSAGLGPAPIGKTLSGPATEHRIYLEPHGGFWLVALDHPAAIRASGAEPLAGGYWRNARPVVTSMSYTAASRPENVERTLPRDQAAAALQVAGVVSPAVRALAAKWREQAGQNDDAVVSSAMNYFRDNHFFYSLQPGTYRGDQMEDFLFRRRIGFCEHYAGAFATLMRLARVPARVVIGYHGGEYNPLGQFVRVSQADAHAWCEVWRAGIGWRRVDPTSAIAPDRISGSLSSYLEGRGASSGQAGPFVERGIGWQRAWRGARMMWDGLAYQWDLRVMNYDQESQLTLLAALKLDRFSDSGRLAGLVVATFLALAGLGAWLRRSGTGRPRDPAQGAFADFCDVFAAVGIRREPWEAPGPYAARAAAAFPLHAERIRRIGELYTAVRYGRHSPSPAELLREVRALIRQQRSRPARKPMQKSREHVSAGPS